MPSLSRPLFVWRHLEYGFTYLSNECFFYVSPFPRMRTVVWFGLAGVQYRSSDYTTTLHCTVIKVHRVPTLVPDIAVHVDIALLYLQTFTCKIFTAFWWYSMPFQSRHLMGNKCINCALWKLKYVAETMELLPILRSSLS